MSRTLQHIRLPSPISYATASRIQDTLVRRRLDTKQRDPHTIIQNSVLTMQMSPVYTTGRRERGLMTPDERENLSSLGADVVESLRGGQTTFHGPGQMVAYPLLDLSPRNVNLRPRCYVDLLEQCIIDTLQLYGLRAKRTEHTGVWTDEVHKIAAIGVHLRRNITSHGVALNVDTQLHYFDQIVACGLADKKTTSMRAQGYSQSVEEVATQFVNVLADKLGLDVVESELHDE